MTIHELRTLSNLSIKEFALFFDIPYRTVQDWDSGKRVPPVWVVKLLEYKLKKEHLLKESE